VVKLSKRRGISTIVGGLIFLVLMASAFSTFYIAFDVQKDTINTQRDISNSIVEKTQEQFVISAGTDPNDNNRLGIQVKNEGPNPVEVANIWIVNKSGVNEPAKRYDINYADVFVPPGYGAPILENTPLYLNPAYGTDYTVKVVSSLGSIKTAPVTVSGSTNLLAEIFAIPPDVRLGENVTVAMRVTNIGDTPLKDVEPEVIPPTVIPSSAVSTSQFISPSPVTLDPTESTIFTWHYTLSSSGTVGSKVSFSSFANGTDSATNFNYVSNTATDKITIRDDGSQGSGTEIVLKDELFGRPEIFMVIPNVFGESDDKGLWGVTVANPTNATMYVSKVTTNLLRANSNDNHRVFLSPCSLTAISPSSGWSCPNQNSLTWKNVASPQAIGPLSSFSFLSRVQPGIVAGSTPALESLVVSTSVFTSLGAFGKGPYDSSMRQADDALVNVYFSDPGGSTNNADIRGNIQGVMSGETRQYNVTLADFTDDPENIEAGSKLIINIPKDFTFISVDSNVGFTVPAPVPFPDGSTQIVGTLNSALDDGGLYIQFTAKAPTVSSTKMYVFHVLGTGSTSPSLPKLSIGPLAETVIQVCPTSGCP
jgi:hypothetical protein